MVQLPRFGTIEVEGKEYDNETYRTGVVKEEEAGRKVEAISR